MASQVTTTVKANYSSKESVSQSRRGNRSKPSNRKSDNSRGRRPRQFRRRHKQLKKAKPSKEESGGNDDSDANDWAPLGRTYVTLGGKVTRTRYPTKQRPKILAAINPSLFGKANRVR